MGLPKRKVVFQSSLFEAMLNFRRVTWTQKMMVYNWNVVFFSWGPPFSIFRCQPIVFGSEKNQNGGGFKDFCCWLLFWRVWQGSVPPRLFWEGWLNITTFKGSRWRIYPRVIFKGTFIASNVLSIPLCRWFHLTNSYFSNWGSGKRNLPPSANYTFTITYLDLPKGAKWFYYRVSMQHVSPCFIDQNRMIQSNLDAKRRWKVGCK